MMAEIRKQIEELQTQLSELEAQSDFEDSFGLSYSDCHDDGVDFFGVNRNDPYEGMTEEEWFEIA